MKKLGLIALLFFSLSLLMFAGCERKIVNEDAGDDLAFTSCFTCHGDDGLLLAAKGEWQNSVHASGNNVDYTNRGGTDCTKCHDHQGFIDYLETSEVDPPYSNVSAIHCFTCHAPHTNGNLSLRTTAAYTLENGDTFDHGNGNLCANCHHSRYSVDNITDNIEVSTYWGPHHGPQGDLLTASNGYEFDGYTYTTSTHASVVRDACAGCHMGQPQAHDGYKIGGHSFNMYDSESGSDLSALCEECHASADSYDFTADADYDHDGNVEGYQTEILGLTDSLRTLLLSAGVLDSTDHPVSQTIANEETAGALFNFLLVHEDRSHGIHNFNYIKDLLQSSIEYLD
ncbi:MAG: hypothetical protein GF307_03920 [candidate division Zixibacteria bacterium]|nr:hypothetical protein [candidate division Zixibacteria bacterium]